MNRQSQFKQHHVLAVAFGIIVATCQTCYSQTKPSCGGSPIFPPTSDLALYQKYSKYYNAAYNGGFENGTLPFSPTSASVSISESSTSQSLDLIAERRAQDMQKCPAGFANVGGTCKRVSLTSDSSGSAASNTDNGQTNKPSGARAQQIKQVKGSERASEPASSASSRPSQEPSAASFALANGSLKDGAAAPEDAGYGAWIEGFYGYEKQAGIPSAGGNLNRTQHYYEVLTGFDETAQIDADTSLKFGPLFGYSHTSQQYSTAISQGYRFDDFKVPFPGNGNPGILDLVLPNFHTILSAVDQTLDGPSVGFYGSLIRGGWFSDFLARADMQTVSQIVSQDNIYRDLNKYNQFDWATGCLVYRLDVTKEIIGTFPPKFDKATHHFKIVDQATTENNYTLADNIGYRFDLPVESFWFEPTVGAMYTYASLGSNAAELGLRDGYNLRLQGGGRLGMTTTFMHDYIWTGSIAAIYYNDVIVSGYDVNNSSLGSAAAADQGKSRVLGILQSRIDFLNGISTYTELDTYGGSNLFGIGGRLGARYQW